MPSSSFNMSKENNAENKYDNNDKNDDVVIIEDNESLDPVISIKTAEELENEKQLCSMLWEQRERLEERLVQLLDELKRLCIAEGELIGQLPNEIYKTLLPGEPVPQVKRRVGTAFKYPQTVLSKYQGQNANDDDDISRLEVDVELNRRIVAAAERLANDRSANKSVRKKRRKDLQAATVRLRGLEKGLNCARFSTSKPDVSSLTTTDASMAGGTGTIGRHSGVHAGSGFSLNSLKYWPNFYNSIRNHTKSCPTTPRGSVPDLSVTAVCPTLVDPLSGSGIGGITRKQTPTTAKKLHNFLKDQRQQHNQHQQQPFLQTTQQYPPPIAGNGTSKYSISSLSTSSDTASASCPSTSSLLSLNNATGLNSGNNNYNNNKMRSGGGGGITMSSATTSTSSGISSANGITVSGGTKKMDDDDDAQMMPCSNWMSMVATTTTVGTTTAAAPPVPSRRSSATSSNANLVLNKRCSIKLEATHLYANIGYTPSTPYKSAYRQLNFPTLHNPNRSPNSTTSPSTTGSTAAAVTPISTSFSVVKLDSASYIQKNYHLLSQSAAAVVPPVSASSSRNSNQTINTTVSSSLSTSALPLRMLANNGMQHHHHQSTSYSTTSLDRRSATKGHSRGTTTTMRRRMMDGNGTGNGVVVDNNNANRNVDECDLLLRPHYAAHHQQRIAIRLPIPDLAYASNDAAQQKQEEEEGQQSTTFPVNDTFRSLESADFARFRSISAILECQQQQKHKKRQHLMMAHQQMPATDVRMEALLASIQQQQQEGGGVRFSQHCSSSLSRCHQHSSPSSSLIKDVPSSSPQNNSKETKTATAAAATMV